MSDGALARPTRPDRLTTWPVELGEFGVDVEWRTGRGTAARR
jgi:hypothetical protein